MSVATCLRHVAAPEFEVLQRKSWLPFLYRTKTIQHRAYSERTNASAASVKEELEEIRRRWSGRVESTYLQDARGNKSEGNGMRRHRKQGRLKESSNKPGFVPFEHLPTQIQTAADTSTITQVEQRAFQNLLALQKKSSMPNDPLRGSTTSGSGETDLDKILNEALRTQLSRASTKSGNDNEVRWITKRQQQIHSPESAVQKKANADVRRVNSLMRDATTDAKLWAILQEHVILRVLALNLDVPDRPVNRRRKSTKQSTAQRAGQTAPSDSDELQTLTHALSQHLANFHSNLRESFPTSSLGLALLPSLHQLGPTAFALGATTELFNTHLHLLFSQQTDINGMVETLKQMHQHVYDFDCTTHDIISSVFLQATACRAGPRDQASYAVWTSDSFDSALRRLYQWSAKVHEQIEERALRDARLREDERSDEEVEGDGTNDIYAEEVHSTH